MIWSGDCSISNILLPSESVKRCQMEAADWGAQSRETHLCPSTHSIVTLKERQSDKLLNGTHNVTGSPPPSSLNRDPT